MGQPTHPLVLHAGKSQLWSWGCSVLLSESTYAWQARRTLVGFRYVLSFLSGLLVIHASHPWAPARWHKGLTKRHRSHYVFRRRRSRHFPNLALGYVKRRYFRYTPRKVGFTDGDNTFFEFAMDRRWSFFRSRAWGEVQVIRLGSVIIVSVSSVPLHTHGPFRIRRRRRVFLSSILPRQAVSLPT